MIGKIALLFLLANFHNAKSQCGLPSGPCSCASIGNPFSSGEDVSDLRPIGPLVVRPQPLPKPTLSLTSTLGQTAGGPCVIRKAIVKPAIMPRPVYGPQVTKQGICHAASALATAATALCEQSSQQQQIQQQIQQQQNFAASSNQYLGNSLLTQAILNGQVQKNCAPADAVSLALAYNQAMEQKRVLSEDKLAFGFRKLPIELPKIAKIPKPEVCEENLYSLNGQIVELKPVAATCSGKTLEEEAEDELLNLSEEETNADVGNAIRKVSLGEIGYAPAKDTSRTFIPVPVVPSASTVIDGAADLLSSAVGGIASSLGASSANGYQAGSVVYKSLPRGENGEDEACDSEDEAEKPQPLVPCTCAAASSGGQLGAVIKNLFHHSTSSSSSSSSHQRSSKSLCLEKLC